MIFLIVAVASFLISFGCALLVRQVALCYKIVDLPGGKRKTHNEPRPLLGGFALYTAFFIVLFTAYFLKPEFFVNFTWFQMLALFYGGTLLMLGGYLDDQFSLRPRYQIIFPIVAALMILFGGVNLTHITNPFGLPFNIGRFSIAGVPVVVSILIFLWLLAMMYTTKILDGVDGLVSGVTTIGALMIFFLTQSQRFFQPDVGLLSLIFVGAGAGFLILNFPPAKLFLGEGGSLFTGFILGNLAIIAGSKIATTLLVMGLPMIDLAYTVYRRYRAKAPLFVGDAGHLHFKLLNKGLSPKRLVLFKYFIAAGFGISTLVLPSGQKFIALLFLTGSSLTLIWYAHRS